jgi:hypothetical protein
VAPTGAALIVDANHWDGAAFQTMFATRPQIAAAASGSIVAIPDGTYRYRCFDGYASASLTDRLLSLDVDQIGSVAPGTDLHIYVRSMSFQRPLDQFLLATEYA